MHSLLFLLLPLTIPTSPEEFLETLADSTSGLQGAMYWVESASPISPGSTIGTDSMAAFLGGFTSISVEPGDPRLLETDQVNGSYLVDYPEAEWSWIDEDGRVIRAIGNTRVEMSEGRYCWVELPLFDGGAFVSPAHRLLAGFLVMVFVLGLGIMILWWVRRRYMGA